MCISFQADAIVRLLAMSNFKPYKGSYPYKTDSKNRVTVVPAWRPAQGEPLNLMPSLRKGHKIINVLSQEAFEYRLNVIDKNATSPKEHADLTEKLVRLMREVQVNEQGKILIPKDLADYAEIEPESEVTLSAGSSHFEIWNRGKFDSAFGLEPVPEEEDHLRIF